MFAGLLLQYWALLHCRKIYPLITREKVIVQDFLKSGRANQTFILRYWHRIFLSRDFQERDPMKNWEMMEALYLHWCQGALVLPEFLINPKRILARNQLMFELTVQLKRVYQNAEVSLQAQQCGDKAARHLSGSGASSALQSQIILIWILLNSGTKKNPINTKLLIGWQILCIAVSSMHRENILILVNSSFTLKMK